MKKKALAILAAVIMVLSANFAFADDDINIDLNNDNHASATGGDATATGGDATATVGDISNRNDNNLNNTNNIRNDNTNVSTNVNENKNENWNENVNDNRSKATSSSNLTFINKEAKNFITASHLQNYGHVATPLTPGDYKVMGCNFMVADFTVGQLKNMAEGTSYLKKRGTGWFKIFTDDISYSVTSPKDVELNDAMVIHIMVKHPKRVSSTNFLGYAKGVGRYDAPAGQILGATILGLVQKTGATQVVIESSQYVEALSKSSAMGLGVVGSATERNAGSVALGVAGSTTNNLTGVAETVVVYAYKGMGSEYFSCEEPTIYVPQAPPVVKPEPKPAPAPKEKCSQKEIERLLKRIEEYKEAAKHCPNNCFNNERLWKEIGDGNLKLFDCTGNRAYLSEALYAYSRAEKNFLTGKEPDGALTRNLKGANDVVKNIRYNWSLAVLFDSGEAAQTNFALSKGLTAVPENIDELK